MATVRLLWRRFWALRHSEQVHDEIADEMSFHIEQRTADNIRSGMKPEIAKDEATRRFGHLPQIHEEGYDVRGGGWLEQFAQDFRFSFRMLLRNPGFSVLAILCLTLGIASNAAVFSWIEGILLRP